MAKKYSLIAAACTLLLISLVFLFISQNKLNTVAPKTAPQTNDQRVFITPEPRPLTERQRNFINKVDEDNNFGLSRVYRDLGGNVNSLHLDYMDVSPKDLSTAASLGTLEAIVMIGCELTPDHAKALSASQSLETLNISGAEFDCETFKTLISMPQIKRLITDTDGESKRCLQHIQDMSSLEYLKLSYSTNLDFEVVSALCEMKTLKTIVLEKTNLTKQQILRLQVESPGLEIVVEEKYD